MGGGQGKLAPQAVLSDQERGRFCARQSPPGCGRIGDKKYDTVDEGREREQSRLRGRFASEADEDRAMVPCLISSARPDQEAIRRTRSELFRHPHLDITAPASSAASAHIRVALQDTGWQEEADLFLFLPQQQLPPPQLRPSERRSSRTRSGVVAGDMAKKQRRHCRYCRRRLIRTRRVTVSIRDPEPDPRFGLAEEVERRLRWWSSSSNRASSPANSNPKGPQSL